MKVAVFSTKSYDKEYLDKANEKAMKNPFNENYCMRNCIKYRQFS